MFWIIKHSQSGLRIPKLSTNKAWWSFYSFCEGAPTISRLDEITEFTKCFKYKKRELAEKFVETATEHLQKAFPSMTNFFEIEEYKTWPPKFRILTIYSKIASPDFNVFKITQVDKNWFDLSLIYCGLCGINIPVGAKYLHTSQGPVCPWCIEEAIVPIVQHFETYKKTNTEMVEILEQERFTSRL